MTDQTEPQEPRDSTASELTCLLAAIEAEIAPTAGNCLCGRGEWCEIFDSTSQYNRLRKRIKEIIHGPEAKPTLDDYGRSLTISAEDICR